VDVDIAGGYLIMDDATRALRKTCITGTDIATLWGVVPDKTIMDIWLEKTSKFEVNINNKRTRAGLLHERTLQEEYEALTGIKLYRPEFIKNGIYGGSLDALPVIDEKLTGEHMPEEIRNSALIGDFAYEGRKHMVMLDQLVVEFKTAEWDQYHHWGVAPHGNINRRYFLQCQWYMFITGRKVAHLYIMIGVSDFRLYIIPRHDEVIEASKKLADKFWEKYIIPNEMPPIDASKNMPLYLQKLHPTDNQVMVEANAEMLQKAVKLDEIKKTLKQLEAEEKTLENFFKFSIGENRGIQDQQFKCTWGKCKDTMDVDWKAAFMDEVQPTPEQLAEIEKRYEYVSRKGSRKFDFRWRG
jgi:putative phage-type endonuclease